VFGVFWYRMLTTREPFDERLADELVAVLAGPPPRAASPAQRGR
jgi:phage FluMu protein gp41